MCLILESYQAHQKQKESYRTDKIPFVFLQGKSRHEASLSEPPTLRKFRLHSPQKIITIKRKIHPNRF